MIRFIPLIFLLLLALPAQTQAGTIVITASGFTNLPATAPPNWPSNLTWPGGSSPNGSKTFTVTDADFQAVLLWAANNYNAQLPQAPAAMTAQQVLLQWVQGWINATKNAVVQFLTAPPTPPPPPNFQ